jgi:hypothetical protein
MRPFSSALRLVVLVALSVQPCLLAEEGKAPPAPTLPPQGQPFGGMPPNMMTPGRSGRPRVECDVTVVSIKDGRADTQGLAQVAMLAAQGFTIVSSSTVDGSLLIVQQRLGTPPMGKDPAQQAAHYHVPVGLTPTQAQEVRALVQAEATKAAADMVRPPQPPRPADPNDPNAKPKGTLTPVPPTDSKKP